jgi:ribosomal subunit interface protein
MKITITARHMEVPPLAEEMLRAKAEKLERFGHKLLSLSAVFDKEKYLYTVELTLDVKGVRLVARAKHKSDLLTCIEEALSKLETQLERREDKKVDEVRRRTAHRPA